MSVTEVHNSAETLLIGDEDPESRENRKRGRAKEEEELEWADRHERTT